jgi:hypothetical protein
MNAVNAVNAVSESVLRAELKMYLEYLMYSDTNIPSERREEARVLYYKEFGLSELSNKALFAVGVGGAAC